MRPLLFVPGAKAGDAELLDAVGLEALGLDELFACDAEDLPEALRQAMGQDSPGCFCWWGSPAPPAQSDQAAMQWAAAKPWPERGLPARRFYMGQIEMPKPADLARPIQVQSVPVALDDGQVWQIPVAAYLPKVYGVDPLGNSGFQTEDRFAEYCEAAARFQQAALAVGMDRRGICLTLGDAVKLVHLGLSINYRLQRDLIDWLGLTRFDNSIYWAACASFELQAYAELQQNRATGAAPNHPRYLQALPFLKGMPTPYKPKLLDALLLAEQDRRHHSNGP